ncbi:hypothetical protein HDU76_012003 [Blyttiomyces sp. JEL0837]|nr:hypothetical protein HDU76_012003 [Blyttiomyces sp. JEL0837]
MDGQVDEESSSGLGSAPDSSSYPHTTSHISSLASHPPHPSTSVAPSVLDPFLHPSTLPSASSFVVPPQISSFPDLVNTNIDTSQQQHIQHIQQLPHHFIHPDLNNNNIHQNTTTPEVITSESISTFIRNDSVEQDAGSTSFFVATTTTATITTNTEDHQQQQHNHHHHEQLNETTSPSRSLTSAEFMVESALLDSVKIWNTDAVAPEDTIDPTMVFGIPSSSQSPITATHHDSFIASTTSAGNGLLDVETVGLGGGGASCSSEREGSRFDSETSPLTSSFVIPEIPSAESDREVTGNDFEADDGYDEDEDGDFEGDVEDEDDDSDMDSQDSDNAGGPSKVGAVDEDEDDPEDGDYDVEREERTRAQKRRKRGRERVERQRPGPEMCKLEDPIWMCDAGDVDAERLLIRANVLFSLETPVNSDGSSDEEEDGQDGGDKKKARLDVEGTHYLLAKERTPQVPETPKEGLRSGKPLGGPQVSTAALRATNSVAFSDGVESAHPASGSSLQPFDVTNPSAKRWLSKLEIEEFPSGYKLFFHMRGSGDRFDLYLYGHPSGRRFRSPNEFMPHLKWLSGGNPSNPCLCKVCGGVSSYSPTATTASSIAMSPHVGQSREQSPAVGRLRSGSSFGILDRNGGVSLGGVVLQEASGSGSKSAVVVKDVEREATEVVEEAVVPKDVVDADKVVESPVAPKDLEDGGEKVGGTSLVKESDLPVPVPVEEIFGPAKETDEVEEVIEGENEVAIRPIASVSGEDEDEDDEDYDPDKANRKRKRMGGSDSEESDSGSEDETDSDDTDDSNDDDTMEAEEDKVLLQFAEETAEEQIEQEEELDENDLLHPRKRVRLMAPTSADSFGKSLDLEQLDRWEPCRPGELAWYTTTSLKPTWRMEKEGLTQFWPVLVLEYPVASTESITAEAESPGGTPPLMPPPSPMVKVLPLPLLTDSEIAKLLSGEVIDIGGPLSSESIDLRRTPSHYLMAGAPSAVGPRIVSVDGLMPFSMAKLDSLALLRGRSGVADSKLYCRGVIQACAGLVSWEVVKGGGIVGGANGDGGVAKVNGKGKEVVRGDVEKVDDDIEGVDGGDGNNVSDPTTKKVPRYEDVLELRWGVDIIRPGDFVHIFPQNVEPSTEADRRSPTVGHRMPVSSSSLAPPFSDGAFGSNRAPSPTLSAASFTSSSRTLCVRVNVLSVKKILRKVGVSKAECIKARAAGAVHAKYIPDKIILIGDVYGAPSSDGPNTSSADLEYLGEGKFFAHEVLIGRRRGVRPGLRIGRRDLVADDGDLSVIRRPTPLYHNGGSSFGGGLNSVSASGWVPMVHVNRINGSPVTPPSAVVGESAGVFEGWFGAVDGASKDVDILAKFEEEQAERWKVTGGRELGVWDGEDVDGVTDEDDGNSNVMVVLNQTFDDEDEEENELDDDDAGVSSRSEVSSVGFAVVLPFYSHISSPASSPSWSSSSASSSHQSGRPNPATNTKDISGSLTTGWFSSDDGERARGHDNIEGVAAVKNKVANNRDGEFVRLLTDRQDMTTVVLALLKNVEKGRKPSVNVRNWAVQVDCGAVSGNEKKSSSNAFTSLDSTTILSESSPMTAGVGAVEAFTQTDSGYVDRNTDGETINKIKTVCDSLRSGIGPLNENVGEEIVKQIVDRLDVRLDEITSKLEPSMVELRDGFEDQKKNLGESQSSQHDIHDLMLSMKTDFNERFDQSTQAVSEVKDRMSSLDLLVKDFRSETSEEIQKLLVNSDNNETAEVASSETHILVTPSEESGAINMKAMIPEAPRASKVEALETPLTISTSHPDSISIPAAYDSSAASDATPIPRVVPEVTPIITITTDTIKLTNDGDGLNAKGKASEASVPTTTVAAPAEIDNSDSVNSNPLNQTPKVSPIQTSEDGKKDTAEGIEQYEADSEDCESDEDEPMNPISREFITSSDEESARRSQSNTTSSSWQSHSDNDDSNEERSKPINPVFTSSDDESSSTSSASSSSSSALMKKSIHRIRRSKSNSSTSSWESYSKNDDSNEERSKPINPIFTSSDDESSSTSSALVNTGKTQQKPTPTASNTRFSGSPSGSSSGVPSGSSSGPSLRTSSPSRRQPQSESPSKVATQGEIVKIMMQSLSEDQMKTIRGDKDHRESQKVALYISNNYVMNPEKVALYISNNYVMNPEVPLDPSIGPAEVDKDATLPRYLRAWAAFNHGNVLMEKFNDCSGAVARFRKVIKLGQSAKSSDRVDTADSNQVTEDFLFTVDNDKQLHQLPSTSDPVSESDNVAHKVKRDTLLTMENEEQLHLPFIMQHVTESEGILKRLFSASKLLDETSDPQQYSNLMGIPIFKLQWDDQKHYDDHCYKDC